MKIKKHKQIINLKKTLKNDATKEKMVDRIVDFLEMPKELISNSSKMTLIDNRFFYLEGNNQIMDYFKHYIKIKTPKTVIAIDGKNMEIKEINEKELVIEGEIIGVFFNK